MTKAEAYNLQILDRGICDLPSTELFVTNAQVLSIEMNATFFNRTTEFVEVWFDDGSTMDYDL